MKIFLISFFFINIHLCEISAQVDNVYWPSITFRIIPDEKNAYDVRPISRFHDNFSDYRNTSIDLAYRRKLSKVMTLGILSRTWFLEDGGHRQFFWPTLTAKKKYNKIFLEVILMYHLAIDIKEKLDGDYFRVKTAIIYPLSQKLSARLAIEPWHQFNGQNKITRMRYELVLAYKMSERYSFVILYRRQNDINPRPTFNNYMTTLICRL